METYFSKPLDRLNPKEIEWVPIADGILHLPPDLEREINAPTRKLAEAEAALAALMEYTLGFAATELKAQDYLAFCDHPTVKAAQEIIAENSARG